MKDIYQILREKELAIAQVKKEVEALRFCLKLLSEGDAASAGQPSSVSTGRWPMETEPDSPTGS